jgi:hypothetical protein
MQFNIYNNEKWCSNPRIQLLSTSDYHNGIQSLGHDIPCSNDERDENNSVVQGQNRLT